MKKLFTLIVFILCSFSFLRAQILDVYLKDESVVDDGIIGKTHKDAIKIQIMEDSMFVYDQNEIKQLTNEEKQRHNLTIRILDLPKHSFGIRGGVMLFTNEAYELQLHGSDSRRPIGARVGGVYELELDKKANRWFFQTGLDIQYMNSHSFVTNNNSYESETINSNSVFLEIPATFSYKFKIGSKVILYPSVGLAYSWGLWGKYTYKTHNGSYSHGHIKDRDTMEEGSLFDNYDNCNNHHEGNCHNPHLSNSAILVKLGVNLTYEKLQVEMGGGSSALLYSIRNRYFEWPGWYNTELFGENHPFEGYFHISIGYNF